MKAEAMNEIDISVVGKLIRSRNLVNLLQLSLCLELPLPFLKGFLGAPVVLTPASPVTPATPADPVV
jgi:hypothetical protein